MPLISIVTPTYNEEENVEPLYQAIKAIMEKQTSYEYEHIYIDNASTDGSEQALRRLAAQDQRVKVILNARNFGHIRSPYYGLLQAHGDAVIYLASDFQDPPELINEFIKHWEAGKKVVMGVKTESEESPAFYIFRTLYYRFLHAISNTDLIEHATGFGLYDQEVIQLLRSLDDPYPYFRGLIAELGHERAIVLFHQPQRKRGITKNNFYTLYDTAMIGLTSYTRVPLRIATMVGVVFGAISFLIGIIYLVYKLLDWQNFSLGLAPLVVGMFFLGSVQLFFLGILGEYIGAILTQVQRRPLVVEKERINF
jgi:polyisoprenyl-phosphate glycosyltransferase